MSAEPNQKEFIDAIKAEVKGAYQDLDKKTEGLAQAIDEAKKLIGEKASTADIDGRIKDLQAELKKGAERADEIERKANRAGLFGKDQPETKGACSATIRMRTARQSGWQSGGAILG